MRRAELAARLAAMGDDELVGLLAALADGPAVPDRAAKAGMVAAEVRARPLGRYLAPGEDAGDAGDVAWAAARRALFGDLVEGNGR